MSSFIRFGHCCIVQSEERPKGLSLVQLYRTDVGSNPGHGLGVRVNCRLKIPSHAIRCGIKSSVWEPTANKNQKNFIRFHEE